MPDFERVRGNVRRMIEGGAEEAEIDAYLNSEGTSAEDLRYQHEIDIEARRRQASDIPGEAVDYTQATAGDMMTVGALPQIIAGARTGLGFLGDYGRERDIMRRQINLRRE